MNTGSGRYAMSADSVRDLNERLAADWRVFSQTPIFEGHLSDCWVLVLYG